ncbi:hypothetical protein MSG28_015448 [Choristoneura fumiferana]|uniref:Uncharacterized protein n=1 Tax=Choristoneura fumiferana TaxID=7141 RepID=A0ACC0KAC3_CHOFU|nr:hypothetical protein MSG28_015448 [Choristoneura fumiferana]
MPVNMESKTARKSLAPIKFSQPKVTEKPKLETSRKSMLPTKVSESREKTQFSYKSVTSSSLIANKRHTVFEPKVKAAPVRRSISAVHFKRISKKELGNCFHKWSSIGEKLNEVHLTNINEDDSVKQDVVTSAIKSERKKVRLQTPSSFNTPQPEELQNRLSNGKTVQTSILPPEPIHDNNDDENKENIALEHDSDNESYSDNMNDRANDLDGVKNKWRSRVSYASDSIMNDSHDTTLNSDELPVDDLLLGALNDLTELLREGFDWEQCARWLRAIRERFPDAPRRAAYWECRAALEERRGDLPASVQCWEEAIAKGTKHSVVDANLDQLLDKFMQLKISPSGGRRERPDPKLVDVKNVFKSTIIRFAVQQAKLRQSQDHPKYTMTPVRRSSRLSSHWSSKKTPLKLCSSVKQADVFGDVLFVPNATLCETP